MSAALVPVKRLAAGKSRLLPELAAEAREALCLAMLHDVLGALHAAARVDRVAVVTPDLEVAAAAHELGTQAILHSEPGLNASIDHAALHLELQPNEALLVLLGDVPGATPADLDALFTELDRLGGRGAVIAPAADGGTAALLRAPHWCLPACFGVQSAERHRSEAQRLGIPWSACALPSLALDLDDADDIERFMASDPERTRPSETRVLLRSLGWRSGTSAPVPTGSSAR